jgi:hypothetical protein
MNQSEPLPSTATAPQSSRGGARPPTRQHNASTPTCRPPVDRDQTDKARLRPHPHPRRGTAAGQAPDLDDSPPSGRPPPEPPAAHLRDVASARRHSAAGSSTSRWARRRPPHPPGTGRGGQRDRPPRPPHHPRDAARKHTPEAGATAKDRGHQHRLALRGGMPGRPVVAGSGRSRYCAPGRGSRFASQPAGRACPLPSAPASGRRWSIPPRRWREGQGHDGWNREMVQRRQGLRLHRP